MCDQGEPGRVLCSNVVRELLLGKALELGSVGSCALRRPQGSARSYPNPTHGASGAERDR